jgi:hypothetical protein
MGGTCSARGRDEKGKTEGERRLTRLIRTWDNNIKIDLKGIRCGGRGVGWLQLVQDRVQFRGLVNAVMKLRVP